MSGAKLLRIGLALIMAIALLTLNAAPAVSSDSVIIQKVEIELMPTANAPFGATGVAELSFITGGSRGLEDLEIEVEAAGLIPGRNHFVFLGNRLIGFQRADIFGRIAIERELKNLRFFNVRRLPIFVADDFNRILLFRNIVDIEDEDFERDFDRERDKERDFDRERDD